MHMYVAPHDRGTATIVVNRAALSEARLSLKSAHPDRCITAGAGVFCVNLDG